MDRSAASLALESRLGSFVTDLLGGYLPPDLIDAVRSRALSAALNDLLAPSELSAVRLRDWTDRCVAQSAAGDDIGPRARDLLRTEAVVVLLLLQHVSSAHNATHARAALPLLAACATPFLLARLQQDGDSEEAALVAAAEATTWKHFETARNLLRHESTATSHSACEEQKCNPGPPLLRPFPQLPPAHPLSQLVFAIERVRTASDEWRAQLSDPEWRELRDAVADGCRSLGVGVDVILTIARSPADAFEQLARRLRSELLQLRPA